MLLKRSEIQRHTAPKGIGLTVAKHAGNSLSFAEEGIFLALQHSTHFIQKPLCLCHMVILYPLSRWKAQGDQREGCTRSILSK